jgi:predicted PurR-regulated permease PerM
MTNQKSHFFVLSLFLFGLFVLALFILFPYFSSLVLAFVFAITFLPFYKKILKLVKFEWLASFLVTLLVTFLILVPIIFLGKLVLDEATDMYNSLNLQQGSLSDNNLLLFLKDKIDKLIPDSWGKIDTTKYIKEALLWLVRNFGLVFSSVAQGIAAFLFSLLMLFYLLKDWDNLFEYFVSRSPLGEKYTKVILEKIRDSINAVVKGSLAVAIVDGIAVGIGFALFGVPNPAIWGSLTVIAALMPMLGTGLVAACGVLFLIFLGYKMSALGLALWSLITLGLMDNFVGPQLVKRGTKIYPLFVLLGVLGGVSVFGLIGFFVGPLVFALLFAVLDIYKTIWQDKIQQEQQ